MAENLKPNVVFTGALVCDTSNIYLLVDPTSRENSDVTNHNLEGIMETTTQLFPPEDPDYFIERQGMHLDPDDGSRRLPRYEDVQ